jgi:hypothetical protein
MEMNCGKELTLMTSLFVWIDGHGGEGQGSVVDEVKGNEPGFFLSG